MKKIFISLLMVFAVAATAFAVPQKPKQERLVNDFAGVLSTNEQRALEQKLVQFDSQTSTQIAFVSVKDLEGLEAIEMATRIMEQWGVGGKEDNGIVIVFKPKTATSNGQIAITTGYGVEHLVTDALAKQVIDYDFIPYFQQGNIYAGLDNGTNILMALTKGEFTGSQYLDKRKSQSSGGSALFFVFIVIILVISRIGRTQRMGGFSSAGSSLPFWLLMGMSGGSRGSSFDDFSSGGGSFGGFGGGFGGGGGASGSW